MKLSKLLFAVVGATMLLGTLVSSASARNLSHSSLTFTATWARMNFRANFGTIECEVTLSERLHAGIHTKTAGSLIGFITDARVRSPGCSRDEATILRETLPWHIQYDSFTGELPTITSVRTRLIGYAIRIGLFGITCLLRSSTTEPAYGIYNTDAPGNVTSATVGGSIRTTCGDVGTLSGTSSSTTANRITLI